MSDPTCDNCGAVHGPDDIFCEKCGYDFITGSLPGADETAGVAAPPSTPPPDPGSPGTASSPSSGGAPAPGAPAPSQAAAPFPPPSAPAAAPVSGSGLFEENGGPPSGATGAAGPVTRFSVGVDRSYFEVVVSEGELEFPDPVPPAHDLEIPGEEIHLGRTSESRAIHPDLDISALTGDPAVSSRHAVIRLSGDGTLTVTDIGSTNGTFVGAVDSEAISVGRAVAFDRGVPVYLGAWTRVVAVEDGAPPSG